MILLLLPGTDPIISHPMIYSKWLTLHFHLPAVSSHSCKQDVSDIALALCQGVSSHLILWPTACEWHYSFMMVSSSLFPWPTGSEWHSFFIPGSLITSHPMTNRKWETVHWISVRYFMSHDWQQVSDTTIFVCKAVLSSMPWPTVCEWLSLVLWQQISLVSNRM